MSTFALYYQRDLPVLKLIDHIDLSVVISVASLTLAVAYTYGQKIDSLRIMV